MNASLLVMVSIAATVIVIVSIVIPSDARELSFWRSQQRRRKPRSRAALGMTQ
jgi:hypothetical protein